MPSIRRHLLKLFVFVTVFIFSVNTAAAQSAACLRIEHSYSYGGSVGWSYNGYYDFSIYDPVKGTSRDYLIDWENTYDNQYIRAALSPDGRYILRDIRMGDSTENLTVIITGTGTDRRPLAQVPIIDAAKYDDNRAVWLSDSKHALITLNDIDQKTTRIVLMGIDGKILEKQISEKHHLKYIATTQDNTRLIVYVQDETGKDNHYKIWSIDDLSLKGTFSLPSDAIMLSYPSMPLTVWRPGADEFAYLRKTDKQLAVVFVSPLEPATKAILLPGNANEFELDSYSYPQVIWSPDGRFLSIMLNRTDKTTLSYIYIIDAQSKPYQLQGEVTTRASMADCAGGCPGPRMRWRKDSKALHYLERDPKPNYNNALIVYYPIEKRYQTISKDMWFASEHDPTEELLLVSHYDTNNPDFTVEYVAVDGSMNWTAIQSSFGVVYIYPAPDFRKVVAYAPDGVAGLLWANLDTRQSYQAQFGSRKVEYAVWSADSRLIVFPIEDEITGSIDVGVANVETGKHNVVISNLHDPVSTSIQISSTGQIALYGRVNYDGDSNPLVKVRLFRADGTEIPLNLPDYRMVYYYSPMLRWSADSSYVAVWHVDPESNISTLTILRNDGTILREFKNTPRASRGAKFVWIPCDQPLKGWQARPPADYPIWP
jgi:hypothetical protein